jgi:hypothetical protein
MLSTCYLLLLLCYEGGNMILSVAPIHPSIPDANISTFELKRGYLLKALLIWFELIVIDM